MNGFETYYKNRFQHDIRTFFSTVPEHSKHTFDDKTIFTIQYQTLTKDFEHLNFLTNKEKSYFGTALFFTVLIDQVCYSHFRDVYETFRRLTLYPKLVGNSPSTDRTNLHPSNIFSALNYFRDERKKREADRIIIEAVFNESISVMEKETMEFLRQHFPEINAQDFWERCKSNFP